MSKRGWGSKVSSESRPRRAPVLLLGAAILSCVMGTSSCAPNFVRIFPLTAAKETPPPPDPLDQIAPNKKIRFQVNGGDLTEAVFAERDSSFIRVHLFEWKKQIIGKKKVKSDEITSIAIADLDQLQVLEMTTPQKVVIVATFAVVLGAVVAMATAPADDAEP